MKTIGKSRVKMDRLAERLNIQKQEDWYSVSRSSVPHRTTDSLFRSLKNSYPEYVWNPQLHPSSAIATTIKSKRCKLHREVFDKIALKMKIHKQEDWYNVTMKEAKKHGPISSVVIDYYQGSLFKAFQAVYPEYLWSISDFNAARWNRLKRRVNQQRRIVMDRIAKRLGVEDQHSWYSLTGLQITKVAGGANLLQHFNNSLFNALKSLYPEYEWNPFLFHPTPHYLLPNIENQRMLFDSVAQQLDINTQEEWYHVTATDVKNLGDSIISNYYNNSLYLALKSIYPQFNWNPLLFAAVPVNYLTDLSASSIKESLEFTLPELKDAQWSEHPSSRLLTRVTKRMGFINIFNTLYPHSQWNNHSNGEIALESILKNHMMRVERGKKIAGYSVDFYLPQLSLALEFQGGQHYFPRNTGSFLNQKERDAQKRQSLQQLGVKLVEVPFWWKKDFASLFATLNVTD